MIEAKNVSKTFFKGSRKEQKVLENASLSLPSTGLVCLVGPSGSGKSTILNAIGGLISYDGTILYDGNEVAIEEYRRNHIGYIFQDFLLFDNLSVRDNLKVGLALADVYDEKEVSRRTEILLKAVGLNINSSRSAGALSLGQKQRVAIARALANSPKILLADEPTGNLDSKNSLRIMDILKSLSKDRLVLMVTHNMSLVNLYADQAFRIENRAFVEFNPKGEEVSEVYEEETKKVSFVKSETTVGSLTLSFYAEEGAPARKITIVEKNGKLLVSGENVTLSSMDALKPIFEESAKAEAKKKELSSENGEEKEEEEIDKETAPEPSEDSSDPTLSFTPRKDKKPWKERSFFLSLFNRNPLSQTNYKGKKSFRNLEIILPIISFFFFNLYFASVDLASTAYSPYMMEDNLVLAHYTKEKQKEVRKDSTKAVEFTIDDYIDWKKNDPDLISGPTFTPIQYKEYPSSIGNLYFPSYLITFDDGTTINGVKESSNTPGFLPLEDYKSIFPSELSKYTLADDEVLVDTSFLSSDAYYHGDNVSATITIFPETYSSRHVSLTPYVKNLTYKIKGFVTTDLKAVYASKATTESLQLIEAAMNHNTSNFAFAPRLASLPSLEGVEFLRKTDTSANVTYSEDNLPSTLEDKKFVVSGDYLYSGLPFVTMSDSAKKLWWLSEEGKYSESDSVYYPVSSNPAFLASEGTARDNTDSSKKIMSFSDITYNSYTLDSYSEFYRMLIVSKLLSSIKVDPTLPGETDKDVVTIHLPKGLSDSFKDASWKPKNTEASFVLDYHTGKGEDMAYNSYYYYLQHINIGDSYEGSIDDPILLSQDDYIRLIFQLAGKEPFFTFYAYDSSYQSDLQMTYGNHQFLLSKNPDSTVRILNERYQDQGVVFVKVSVARETMGATDLTTASQSYLIVLGGLILLFLIFSLLDNIGKVNSLRYTIGVKRCLGYKKSEILWENIADLLANFLTKTIVPVLIFVLLLSFVKLYASGFWILLFFLIYLVFDLLSMLIPLGILLGKKPADILHSLN